MFDDLDDPTPPPGSEAELARVRARAAAIRSSRRRRLAAVASSACAVVAVVGVAALVAGRHHSPRAPAQDIQTAASPRPVSTMGVDPGWVGFPPAASPAPTVSGLELFGSNPGQAASAVNSPYPAVTSPMIVQSFAPASAPASPDPATYAAAQRCSADAARMRPSHIPPGLKGEYVSSTQPSLGVPGSLATWSWSDDPAHLSKQLVEFDVTLFCQGHAEFGVTGGDGQRVTQDITISGKLAILWHEYNDTVVGIEFNWGGYGWVQVESQKLANGQPGTHRLSDAEMLAIAQSLPIS
jgi:hypothetical protein